MALITGKHLCAAFYILWLGWRPKFWPEPSSIFFYWPSELLLLAYAISTVKPILSGNSKIDKTKILMINGSFMKVESIAEFSKAILLICIKR